MKFNKFHIKKAFFKNQFPTTTQQWFNPTVSWNRPSLTNSQPPFMAVSVTFLSTSKMCIHSTPTGQRVPKSKSQFVECKFQTVTHQWFFDFRSGLRKPFSNVCFFLFSRISLLLFSKGCDNLFHWSLHRKMQPTLDSHNAFQVSKMEMKKGSPSSFFFVVLIFLIFLKTFSKLVQLCSELPSTSSSSSSKESNIEKGKGVQPLVQGQHLSFLVFGLAIRADYPFLARPARCFLHTFRNIHFPSIFRRNGHLAVVRYFPCCTERSWKGSSCGIVSSERENQKGGHFGR